MANPSPPNTDLDDSDADSFVPTGGCCMPPPLPTLPGFPPPPAPGGGPYIPLRKEGDSCYPEIMRTCRQIYQECLSIIFHPMRSFAARLSYINRKGHFRGPQIELLCDKPFMLPHLGDERERNISSREVQHSKMLVRLLAPINSLVVALPCATDYPQYLRPAIESFVELIIREWHGRSPFRCLHIQLSAPTFRHAVGGPPPPPNAWPIHGPPPPPYPPLPRRGMRHSRPIADQQAALKWALLPFQQLYNLEEGQIRVTIGQHGRYQPCHLSSLACLRVR